METVDMAELVRFARIPLELNLKPGQDVLILADNGTQEILPRAMAAAVREMGSEPTVMVIPTRAAPSMELPKTAAAAIKTADVLVMMASVPIMHTEAMRAAFAAGVINIGMSGITTDTMTKGAATADPHELFAVTTQVAELMTAASTARVTSPHGTDVTMDLRGRSALVLGGISVAGKPGGGFPHGEAPIAPLEESTQGTIVFDTSMNPFGVLSEPVVLRVDKGRVVAIEGGPDAEKLRNLLASKGDQGSYMIGEFAIGTNPKARVTGNINEDKRKRGTVHFGLGDNATLHGTIHAAIHLDGVILRPTVYLDGKTVVKDGELTL